MPMTRPSRSARAPPELPGEMAASVWIRSTRELSCLPPVISAGTSRPVPLTMPDVTVDSKPEGLPTATAIWPTMGSLPAKLAAGRLLRSTLTTAMSVVGSVPTTCPCSVEPSAKATSTLREPSTTWLLVMM